MENFDAAAVREHLPWVELIDAIRTAVAEANVTSPDRHTHQVPVAEQAEATVLLMPAWQQGGGLGVKAVTYFPSNAGTSIPSINAGYLLFSASDGRLLAVLDGDELTARRTAAASALAASFLARPDANRLLIVGTGQLAANMAQAHSAVRPIERIDVWGRRPEAAGVVVAELVALGFEANVAPDLDRSVSEADIVSCVTGATVPLVRGELLSPGTHLDLVGSFKADMRESDDDCIRRSAVFVDTSTGASAAGDLAQPLADGLLQMDDIESDLAGLCAGNHTGRSSDEVITLYKSAGFATLDLAAAMLALKGSSRSKGPAAGTMQP